MFGDQCTTIKAEVLFNRVLRHIASMRMRWRPFTEPLPKLKAPLSLSWPQNVISGCSGHVPSP